MSAPFALDEFLGFHLARLSDALATLAEAEAQEVAGLSLTEYRILMVLLSRGASGVAALQRTTFIDKAWISRVLPRLANKGLVAPAPDPADKRRKAVALTNEGKRIASVLKRRAVARQKRVLGNVSAKERATLIALLKKVQKNTAAS